MTEEDQNRISDQILEILKPYKHDEALNLLCDIRNFVQGKYYSKIRRPELTINDLCFPPGKTDQVPSLGS